MFCQCAKNELTNDMLDVLIGGVMEIDTWSFDEPGN